LARIKPSFFSFWGERVLGFIRIMDWLFENIFTFNPITSISLTSLIGLYILYCFTAFLVASPFFYLARKGKVKVHGFKDILIGVPLEDALFRLLPLYFLGKQATIYLHFIWALLHLKIPTIVWCFVSGLLDLRLWLGGLWIEAIFIHLFHDLLCLTIIRILQPSFSTFGVKKIPTTRSLFSFEQFEAVLQKIAHDIAIKAVTNPKGNMRITTKSNGKFDTVETNEFTIRFYTKHISYNEGSWWKGIKWGFDVEDKIYLTSNHRTKISYYVPEGKTKATMEKKVLEAIDKMMAAEKPEPRFKLSDVSAQENTHLRKP